MSKSPHIAIIGSGPAGLMAASVLAEQKIKTTIFEKRAGPAAKLFVAGGSGLNVAPECSPHQLVKSYAGPAEYFQKIFSTFPVTNWLSFIQGLGLKTFLGTSHRYFIEGLKSAGLIQAWIKRLKDQGVTFCYQKEFTDFHVNPAGVSLSFNAESPVTFDAVCLCLGGASWKVLNPTPPTWPSLFSSKNIPCVEFAASNVGFEVSWTQKFITEAEGKPLKTVSVTSSWGTERCELMVTRYGLEGSPIYRIKKPETIFLDLKPDLSLDETLKRLSHGTENLSPLRRAKKYFSLCPASLALIFHHALEKDKKDLKALTALIKRVPITLTKKRGLDKAISSSGGVAWSALNENLMIKNHPGVFVAGEMIDWDAPTGGFLIQACVAQGHWAGKAMVNWLYQSDKSGYTCE